MRNFNIQPDWFQMARFISRLYQHDYDNYNNFVQGIGLEELDKISLASLKPYSLSKTLIDKFTSAYGEKSNIYLTVSIEDSVKIARDKEDEHRATLQVKLNTDNDRFLANSIYRQGNAPLNLNLEQLLVDISFLLSTHYGHKEFDIAPNNTGSVIFIINRRQRKIDWNKRKNAELNQAKKEKDNGK